jgi:hypothetical protein
MAEHVWMHGARQAGLASGTADDLAHGIRREGRLALADEQVGGGRVVPLQAAQGPQLGTA